MEENSLRNKTIKGVGWSAADALLGQGVTFVTGLVLARLLSPEEYGLVGICLIFTTILNGIVDSGFRNALIRKITIRCLLLIWESVSYCMFYYFLHLPTFPHFLNGKS